MFLFFFSCFSFSSNNIFISVEANESANCAEDSPCSIEKAFSLFQPSDYFILTDHSYDIKKTDQFLTHLESVEANFTVIGCETVFESTSYKDYFFNQTDANIKFSNVVFKTTNITFESASANLGFSNVRFIECDFTGVPFININQSSTLSIENSSFYRCKGILLYSDASIVSFVHTNITLHNSQSTLFLIQDTSFNLFDSKINKVSIMMGCIAYGSNFALKNVRISNIDCSQPLLQSNSSIISFSNTNITKIRPQSDSESVFGIFNENSIVLFKKSIVDRIFCQQNIKPFIILGQSSLETNNFLFQNTKNVVFSHFDIEKVDIKYSTFFNNTIDLENNHEYFMSFNNVSSEYAITNSKFMKNFMTNSLIYNNYSLIVITNSSFLNTYGNTGSVLYNNNGNCTISYSQFNHNEAKESGGCIFSNDGSLYINSTIFSGNKATTGADISIRNSIFTLLNKVTSRESSANKGIFIDAHGKGELQMIDCDFDDYENNAYDIDGIQFDILNAPEESSIQYDQQDSNTSTPQIEIEASETVHKLTNEMMIGDVAYDPPIKDYSATLVIGGIFLFLIISSFIAILLTRRKSGWYNNYSRRKQGKDI